MVAGLSGLVTCLQNNFIGPNFRGLFSNLGVCGLFSFPLIGSLFLTGRMLMAASQRNLGSICQAAGGLRTFPPAAQDGDSGGDSSAVEPSGWGSSGTGPGEDRSTQLHAAPSTYPTCHRLLQRAWGRHLWDGSTWSRWGKARPTVPLDPPRGRTSGPPYPHSFPPPNPSRRLPAPPPPDSLVRGVAAAFHETQRHLRGHG